MIPISTSVAMCTYNGGRYLRAQLASIASQSQLPAELVISDDGSTDGTQEIIREFARTSSFPVHVLTHEGTLGVSKNFEQAIGHCRGDVIFLCDQDDVWNANRIEASLDAFQTPAVQYVFSDAELIDDAGHPAGTSLWQFDREVSSAARAFCRRPQLDVLLKRNIVTGATMAFRSSLKRFALPIPAGWIHDYWIAVLGSVLGDGLLLPERLVQYRVHASQQLGLPNLTVWRKCTRSLPDMLEDYESRYHDFAELEQRVSGICETHPRNEALKKIHEKVLHLQSRKNSHEVRGVARWKSVVQEALSGRYSRYSNSWRSILRDICPPQTIHALRLLVGLTRT